METILNSTDPIFVVDGRNFLHDLSAQIPISIFLALTYFEYVLQTVLIVYVFLTVLFKSNRFLDVVFVVFGLSFFLLIRATLIPVILTPLPFTWAPEFPKNITQGLFYFNVAVFGVTYTCSVIACIYFIVRYGITRKKMKGSVIDPKTGSPPMVVILMPIYNEEPEALARAVESAIRCDYPADRKHVFLAFDEEEETPLFFALLKKLRLLSKEMSQEIQAGIQRGETTTTMTHEKAAIFPPRLEWIIEGVRVTICRFPHEGKSPTQGKSFRVIDGIYGSQPEIASSTLVLFIDSDIILHDNSIHNFVVAAVQNPRIKGMTGLVTCRTSRKFNIYQYLQDAEYVDGQMFIRSAEAVMGSVSCLPGALTLIRLDALQQVAPKYFIEFDNRKSVDFHRYHLGEDRYMTFLLTELSDAPYQVTFVSSAQCKTDAPDTFAKLLKQRRRWFLGGLTNDICMLSSPMMWTRLPFMTLFKMYFYATKGVDWLLGVFIVALIKGYSPGILMYVMFGTLALRYAILCLNAFLLSRQKIGMFNVLLMIASPVFQLTVTLYSIWTWNVRSWGGPRADAGESEGDLSKADIIQEVMKHQDERQGKTRKSILEIKAVGRLVDRKLQAQSHQQVTPSVIVEVGDEMPLKRFVPFPYEMEFLGGGDFDSNLLQPMAPGSPASLKHGQDHAHARSGLQSSSSMPDLSKLHVDGNYLIGKLLSSDTLERAASFRLDKDYLAKIEQLATFENSLQRNSSFNSRLSGRSSPLSYSREPSVNEWRSEESVPDSLSASDTDKGIVINFDE